ncbi:O-antigen ligase family protein [Mycolicibacterium duvalii]|nr:O-antigen ligase family protein [Mycolicibacterium duvalii]
MLISNLDYFASILGGRTILEIGNRSAGFFQHPNQYAIWIGSFLPVVLLVVKRLSVLVLLASNALVALLLTGSKFNIFLAALLLCLCIAVRMRSGLRASVLSIFAVGVSLAFFSSILDFLFRAMEAVNPKYSAAFRAVIETPTESQTFLARMSLWREAMDYGLDNPVTGIGGGQAYLVLQRGIPHAHNLEMHYFMTYGLLGLSGLLVIFLVTFVYGLKGKTHQNYEYRLKYALLISIGAIFISNQSSDSLAGQQILLLGILVGFVLSAAEVRLDASRADKLPSTSEPMVEMDHPLTMRS